MEVIPLQTHQHTLKTWRGLDERFLDDGFQRFVVGLHGDSTSIDVLVELVATVDDGEELLLDLRVPLLSRGQGSGSISNGMLVLQKDGTETGGASVDGERDVLRRVEEGKDWCVRDEALQSSEAVSLRCVPRERGVLRCESSERRCGVGEAWKKLVKVLDHAKEAEALRACRLVAAC